MQRRKSFESMRPAPFTFNGSRRRWLDMCGRSGIFRESNGRIQQLFSASSTRALSSSNGIKDQPPSNAVLVERMRDRLKSVSTSPHDAPHHNNKEAWDELWQTGTTPWDLRRATPVIRSELEKYCSTTEISFVDENNGRPDRTQSSSSRVFRYLVPGCGSGYDLVSLAQHHQDWISNVSKATTQGNASSSPPRCVVVGLDISETSLLKHAVPVVAAAYQSDSELPIASQVDLVLGDFFNGPWDVLRSFGCDDDDGMTIATTKKQHASSSKCQADELGLYDCIVDYTFFCALPPTMRQAWGERMASLLTPDTGRLLTIMFPMRDDGMMVASPTDADQAEGPPYPLTIQDYRTVLEPHGVYIRSDYGGSRSSPDTVPARAGRELVCWWSRQSRDASVTLSKL